MSHSSRSTASASGYTCASAVPSWPAAPVIRTPRPDPVPRAAAIVCSTGRRRARPDDARAGSARRSLVHPGLLDAAPDLGEIGPVLAAVVPPALDATHLEPALPCVLAVDVGDLELAARRRVQVIDDVEHVGRV